MRDADNAYQALNGRVFLGVRLRLYAKKDLQLPRLDQSEDYGQGSNRAEAASFESYAAPAENRESDRQVDREMRCREGM